MLGSVLKHLNRGCINIDLVLETAFLDDSLFVPDPFRGENGLIIPISPGSQGNGSRFFVALELTVF